MSTPPLLLRAVGDLLLSCETPDWADPGFLDLVRLLRRADLSLGNMESPLVESGLPIRKLDISRTDRDVARQLKRMGFGALSLANNHIMDYGVGGMRSTCRCLGRAGISWAGAGRTCDSAFAPTWLEVGGRRVAFLSAHAYHHATWDHYPDDIFADTHKPGAALIQGYKVRIPDPAGSGDYVAEPAPEERFLAMLLEQVERARKQADLVVLAMHVHWGVHDVDRVDLGRRVIAHEAVQAGADLVVGHGPHVLNGVEHYRGAFILHSLGNFFFHVPAAICELYPEARPFIGRMDREERFWIGLMAEVELPNPSRVVLRPCAIAHEGPHRGMPRTAPEAVVARAEELLAAASAPLGVRIERDGDLLVARPA